MRKKTHEEFISELKKINDNITIMSKYVNCKTKVKYICNICGNIHYAKPNNLLQGKGCPVCAIKRNADKCRKSKEDFIEQLKSVNPNIEILGDYTTARKKIKYKCKQCHSIHYAKPDNLLSGFGCPSCYDLKRQSGILHRKTHKDFIRDLSKVDKSLIILSKYEHSHAIVVCQCKICGNTWRPYATDLLSGKGCPHCKSSNGEKKIRNFLNEHKITYIDQKKFDNLLGVGNGKLSYDFYLPTYNLLIEFQGQFHDGTVSFQTPERFEIQKTHDELKRNYAKDNSIELLEIWYYDLKNIQKILSNKLLK